MTAWFQTTPLICTVGKASALTVNGSPGLSGAVSAAAGAAPPVATSPTATSATEAADATSRRRMESSTVMARPGG